MKKISKYGILLIIMGMILGNVDMNVAPKAAGIDIGNKLKRNTSSEYSQWSEIIDNVRATDLQYVNINFRKISLSEKISLSVNAFIITSFSFESMKRIYSQKIDGEKNLNDFCVQIPINETEGYVYISVQIDSTDQMELGDGFIVEGVDVIKKIDFATTSTPVPTPTPTVKPTVIQTPKPIVEATPKPVVTPIPSVVEKEEQYITADSIQKEYGSKPFYLDAETDGDGELSFESSNENVATISWSGKVSIKNYGKSTITIWAEETDSYYDATEEITITVVPKKASITKVSSPAKRQVSFTWKKDNSVTGYQIECSPSKSFGKETIQRVIGSKKNTTKTPPLLKSGKKYYVRVRAYKKVGTKKYYGKRSVVKSIKVK